MRMITRRFSLKLLAISLLSLVPGLQKPGKGATASLPPPEIPLENRLREVLQGRNPVAGKVKLIINSIIEDGGFVPVGIEFDELLSGSDPLESLSLTVDDNPDPLILTVRPNPRHGVGSFHTRIRMRKSSRVAVYAATRNGMVYFAEKKITVTAGGCN